MNEKKLIDKLKLWTALHGFDLQDLHSQEYSCSYCNLRKTGACNSTNIEWQNRLIANIQHNKINKIKINKKRKLYYSGWTCIEFINND